MSSASPYSAILVESSIASRTESTCSARISMSDRSAIWSSAQVRASVQLQMCSAAAATRRAARTSSCGRCQRPSASAKSASALPQLDDANRRRDSRQSQARERQTAEPGRTASRTLLTCAATPGTREIRRRHRGGLASGGLVVESRINASSLLTLSTREPSCLHCPHHLSEYFGHCILTVMPELSQRRRISARARSRGSLDIHRQQRGRGRPRPRPRVTFHQPRAVRQGGPTGSIFPATALQASSIFNLSIA